LSNLQLPQFSAEALCNSSGNDQEGANRQQVSAVTSIVQWTRKEAEEDEQKALQRSHGRYRKGTLRREQIRLVEGLEASEAREEA